MKCNCEAMCTKCGYVGNYEKYQEECQECGSVGRLVWKDSCYRPNDDTYPLCKGAGNPDDFDMKDCSNCNLYENMDESRYDENYYMVKVILPEEE